MNTPAPKIANREQMQMDCHITTIFRKAARLLNITNHGIILIPGQTNKKFTQNCRHINIKKINYTVAQL
jgi:hypothetical protein